MCSDKTRFLLVEEVILVTFCKYSLVVTTFRYK